MIKNAHGGDGDCMIQNTNKILLVFGICLFLNGCAMLEQQAQAQKYANNLAYAMTNYLDLSGKTQEEIVQAYGNPPLVNGNEWRYTIMDTSNFTNRDEYGIILRIENGMVKGGHYVRLALGAFERDPWGFGDDPNTPYNGLTLSERIRKEVDMEKEAERMNKLKALGNHPDWSQEVKNAVLKSVALLGMTTEQVKLSLGSPDDANRTVGAWGVHEQWVYEYGDTLRHYYYFENGILTSFQD